MSVGCQRSRIPTFVNEGPVTLILLTYLCAVITIVRRSNHAGRMLRVTLLLALSL